MTTTPQTVHLGLVGTTQMREHTSQSLEDWGFVLDGDSYTTWGESLNNLAQAGDPLHVTWSAMGALNNEAALDTRYSSPGSSARSTGWSTTSSSLTKQTDQADWSADVRIVGVYA